MGLTLEGSNIVGIKAKFEGEKKPRRLFSDPQDPGTFLALLKALLFSSGSSGTLRTAGKTRLEATWIPYLPLNRE